MALRLHAQRGHAFGRLLSDVDIERVDAQVGEVKVSRAIAEMLEPAHA